MGTQIGWFGATRRRADDQRGRRCRASPSTAPTRSPCPGPPTGCRRRTATRRPSPGSPRCADCSSRSARRRRAARGHHRRAHRWLGRRRIASPARPTARRSPSRHRSVTPSGRSRVDRDATDESDDATFTTYDDDVLAVVLVGDDDDRTTTTTSTTATFPSYPVTSDPYDDDQFSDFDDDFDAAVLPDRHDAADVPALHAAGRSAPASPVPGRRAERRPRGHDAGDRPDDDHHDDDHDSTTTTTRRRPRPRPRAAGAGCGLDGADDASSAWCAAISVRLWAGHQSVLAAVGTARVWRSTDGGATWTPHRRSVPRRRAYADDPTDRGDGVGRHVDRRVQDRRTAPPSELGDLADVTLVERGRHRRRRRRWSPSATVRCNAGSTRPRAGRRRDAPGWCRRPARSLALDGDSFLVGTDKGIARSDDGRRSFVRCEGSRRHGRHRSAPATSDLVAARRSLRRRCAAPTAARRGPRCRRPASRTDATTLAYVPGLGLRDHRCRRARPLVSSTDGGAAWTPLTDQPPYRPDGIARMPDRAAARRSGRRRAQPAQPSAADAVLRLADPRLTGQRTAGRTSAAKRCRSSIVASNRSWRVRRVALGQRRHADQVVQAGLGVGADRVDELLHAAGGEERPQHRHHQLVRDRDRPARPRPAPPPPRRRPAPASTRRCGSRSRTGPPGGGRPASCRRPRSGCAAAAPAAGWPRCRGSCTQRPSKLLGPSCVHRSMHAAMNSSVTAPRCGPQVVDAEGVELLAHPADADAEHDAPVRDAVDRRQLLGQHERVAVRHDQHAGADLDPLGAPGDRRHHGDRVVDELLGAERRVAGLVVEVARRDPGRHDDVVVHPHRVVAEALGLVGDGEATVDAGIVARRSRSCPPSAPTCMARTVPAAPRSDRGRVVDSRTRTPDAPAIGSVHGSTPRNDRAAPGGRLGVPARQGRDPRQRRRQDRRRRAALRARARLRADRPPAARERPPRRARHHLPRRAGPGEDAHDPLADRPARRVDADHRRQRDQRRPVRTRCPATPATSSPSTARTRRSRGSTATTASARSWRRRTRRSPTSSARSTRSRSPRAATCPTS